MQGATRPLLGFQCCLTLRIHDVEVKDEDLRVDTYRAGGAGGQHVNKTDSAVRLTHLPTGIVVQCQNERSQLKNRSMAMKMLKARLYDLERKKKESERDKIEAAKKEIDFGSQIRSYVLHPYRMVKDLRTDYETGNADAVLNGDPRWLHPRIFASKKAKALSPPLPPPSCPAPLHQAKRHRDQAQRGGESEHGCVSVDFNCLA